MSSPETVPAETLQSIWTELTRFDQGSGLLSSLMTEDDVPQYAHLEDRPFLHKLCMMLGCTQPAQLAAFRFARRFRDRTARLCLHRAGMQVPDLQYYIVSFLPHVVERWEFHPLLREFKRGSHQSYLHTHGHIDHWETFAIADMSNAFRECDLEGCDLSRWCTQSLVEATTMFREAQHIHFSFAQWDMRNVRRMIAMFMEVRDAVELRGLDQWDVSNCVSTRSMFHACTALERLDLRHWQVGTHLTNLTDMFRGCTRLQLDHCGLDQWDLSVAANDLSGMFQGCHQLHELDLSRWDVRGVRRFVGMFRDCIHFHGRFRHWRLDSVIDMEAMFDNCLLFDGRDLDTWTVGAHLLFLASTFQNCSNLTDVNLNNFDVSHVEDFSHCFDGCTDFRGDLSAWDTSSATSMEAMFQHCKAFDGDLSAWDTRCVTTFRDMFRGCSAFNHPVGLWNVRGATDFGGMFAHCAQFNQPFTNWQPISARNLNRFLHGCAQFNQPILFGCTRALVECNSMLRDAAAFNQPFELDVSRVTDAAHLFESCVSFNQPLHGLHFSDCCDDMTSILHNCLRFNCSVRGWRIAPIANRAFKNCCALTHLGKLDTTCLIEARSMFEGCWLLHADLSGLHFPQLRIADNMFAYCANFHCDVSGWDCRHLQRANGMFAHASSFDGDIDQWTAFPEEFDDMLLGCSSFTHRLPIYLQHPDADVAMHTTLHVLAHRHKRSLEFVEEFE